MNRKFINLLLLVLTGFVFAQSLTPATVKKENTLLTELLQLYRVDLLPHYRSHSIVAQVSSYDTTGGNNDGFSGMYSYIRKEGNNRVLAELRGPGVIHRIWTPTPTDKILQFFFDGEKEPRLSIAFSDLFSGRVFPFLNPVVGNEVGGYYCYLPIPFQKSCKIVYCGDDIKFHQIQYRLLPDNETITSYHVNWSAAEKDALAHACRFWSMQEINFGKLALPQNQKVEITTKTITLTPGRASDLFTAATGGRILGIELSPAAGFSGLNRDILLKAVWDSEPTPAILCPVADFFGYAFGKPSMQGILAGQKNDVNYCYLPMPFAHNAQLTFIYINRKNIEQSPLEISAKIYYTTAPLDTESEGKLYTQWRRINDPEKGKPWIFADITGKGHYAGTILIAQGLTPGVTRFFEGDDITWLDGEMRLHGTGSEDYFNGGWYAILNRWDRSTSLPVHGSLDYSIPDSRTGGYRFYLADKLSFEKNCLITMEHGPEGNLFPVDYTSVAFYYADQPPLQAMEPTDDLRRVFVPNSFGFTTDLLKLTLAPHTIADFQYGSGIVIKQGRKDEDGEVRLDLSAVPAGVYDLYMTYYNNPGGGEFSIWQRQNKVSDWKDTFAAAEKLVENELLGEVTITDFIDYISIKTRQGEKGKEFKFSEFTLRRK
ncbi:MAG TPA: DUF2961 domain-containing protein [bacterium]|nr:DUF2961 domain-containing protein [bacterium]HPN44098.1 DUF2961 domain-containing protein [bacterium]